MMIRSSVGILVVLAIAILGAAQVQGKQLTAPGLKERKAPEIPALAVDKRARCLHRCELSYAKCLSADSGGGLLGTGVPLGAKVAACQKLRTKCLNDCSKKYP
jgi:hypothetical protein